MKWYEEPFNLYQPGWLVERKRKLFKAGLRPWFQIFDILCDERGFINIHEAPDSILYWGDSSLHPLNETDSNNIKARHLLKAMDEAISREKYFFPSPKISLSNWLEQLSQESILAFKSYPANTSSAIELIIILLEKAPIP